MVIVFDLDDTLYNEIDFVKSGFREVARYLHNEVYYEYMMKVFREEGSGKIFNKLIEKYNLSISLKKLIEIYRFHYPDISLTKDTIELLDFTQQFHTALISDGHYIMQKNKFFSLGLKKYIEFPIFTDFYQTDKLDIKIFKLVMEFFKEEKHFIYIADNPKKDFIVPNKLGWITIRYKNPLGIYKDLESNTHFEIKDIKHCIEILKRLQTPI